MKPIIGVLARPYMTDNGRYVMCILENIRKAVIKSGGIPLMILPTQNMNYLNNRENVLSDEDKEILDTQINLCDGILMPGGDRIYFYDKYVCKMANEKHLPLFGICMGMQVMCNYNNENINEKVEGHKEPKGNYLHDVTIDKNSKLFDILQKESITVNSLHGYKVPNPGEYESTAFCDGNIIEAIEKKDEVFNLGVQWHPEIHFDENDQKLFKSFIYACKKRNDRN
ncbi:MAG: gamma-glutamyl-gamma-aminobutyrate hydrolase family protein [Clostridia bacterium]|nr:gamma-glutamyl-gamma-aminobutyrate hydrolase family protein [Clostridia bacterium]